MNWIIILSAILFFGFSIYWLLIITEGVYLGPKVVVWLYDKTAANYDRIKEFDSEFERQAIAQPLLTGLAGRPVPLLLDVATGTGRVPLLILAEDGFDGQVIGLDASSKMLALGQRKLQTLPALRRRRVALVHQLVDKLPFTDDTFDAVTCLEALEFFPSDEAAIQEMVRVLQPDGLLMTSRRQGWESHFFIGRYHSKDSLCKLLEEAGLAQIEFYPWQINYDMVVARKALH